MSQRDSSRVVDGFLSLEGGIDSGIAPGLIDINQTAWSVNTTYRGGWPTCRPGLKKRNVTFLEGATSGLFQGAGAFIDNDGDSRICYSLSGRLFSINVTKNFAVEEFTPNPTNNPTLTHAWFQAAENMIIVQDGESKPVIWDAVGGGVRATDTQVPIGGPMAYGQGRLWVAKGSEYVGGDLVNSTDQGRKAILYFTENTYLSEGGSFGVPGQITGMSFAANLDTALGTGDLLVFTANSCFAFNAPVDRTVWKNLEYPIQRFALIDFGSFNHEGITTVNGDLFFRAEDGIRSLIYARRDFADWGNTPISRQVDRAIKYDNQNLLYAASSVNFDNRMLMTIQPIPDATYGVWHRGLVGLDFHMVAGMGKKAPPAWEGVWTGLRIQRILTIRVNGANRCFIFALSPDNQLELWELSRNDPFDNNGTDDVRIQWAIETRSMAMGQPNSIKELEYADHWMDDVAGTVDVSAFYKRDNSALWTPWINWSTYAQYRDCQTADAPACQEIFNYQRQIRERVTFPKPTPISDAQDGSFRHIGYELQIRYQFTGKLRLKRNLVGAQSKQETLYGNTKGVTCVAQPQGSCEAGSDAVYGCDVSDYDYSASSSDEP